MRARLFLAPASRHKDQASPLHADPALLRSRSAKPTWCWRRAYLPVGKWKRPPS